MNDQNINFEKAVNVGKFQDPYITAKGDTRASVPLMKATTLWFNTGTLCNIECLNCYIKSSPTNDQLVYITAPEVVSFLDQIEDRKWATTEIAFTGGEPFMNPNMIDIATVCLERGFDVLILTNAMLPMMRKTMQAGLQKLHSDYGDKLTLRISLDHFNADMHDEERGKGAYQKTINGMAWLKENGIRMAVAGRTLWGDQDAASRKGYADLFKQHGFDIDANNPAMTVLFPEMDETIEVPEITTECWGILNKSPRDIMCASSRMVVKRKGSDQLTVLACTLLAYEPEFELGTTLEEAEKPVQLNHPHCSKFCVLGGASCSA